MRFIESFIILSYCISFLTSEIDILSGFRSDGELIHLNKN